MAKGRFGLHRASVSPSAILLLCPTRPGGSPETHSCPHLRLLDQQIRVIGVPQCQPGMAPEPLQGLGCSGDQGGGGSVLFGRMDSEM